MFYPDARIYIMGLIPVKALYLVLIYTAIELFDGIFLTNSGVAHLAHLGGILFAYIYFVVRLRINPLDIIRGRLSR